MIQIPQQPMIQMKINDFFEKQKIGYEINEIMYGVEINEKNSHEQIYFVQHDSQQHEFEQQRQLINELKNYGIGLSEMMKNESQENEFSVNEIANLDYTLAKFILPRLYAFKDLEKQSVPFGFNDMHEWNRAIQHMIDAFELIMSGDYPLCTCEVSDAIDEGLKLFGKYFRYLFN